MGTRPRWGRDSLAGMGREECSSRAALGLDSRVSHSPESLAPDSLSPESFSAMLAADKLLLQSDVKQRSIQLREKELRLFNSNFSAVGTQAAIMAGFTLTSFVEIDLPPEKHYAKKMLHASVVCSICLNFLCVAMVTFVTVWGSGKALRGLDGSMEFAVDQMNAERSFIFACFGLGVLATLSCLLSAAWVLMETIVAAFASCLIFGTMYMLGSEARRIHNIFYVPPNEAVEFTDLSSIFPSIASSSPGVPRRSYKNADGEVDPTPKIL